MRSNGVDRQGRRQNHRLHKHEHEHGHGHGHESELVHNVAEYDMYPGGCGHSSVRILVLLPLRARWKGLSCFQHRYLRTARKMECAGCSRHPDSIAVAEWADTEIYDVCLC